VLRRKFGLNRKDVIEGWRKLRSEELHDMYSPNVRVIEPTSVR
jgi:hypothetical protein